MGRYNVQWSCVLARNLDLIFHFFFLLFFHGKEEKGSGRWKMKSVGLEVVCGLNFHWPQLSSSSCLFLSCSSLNRSAHATGVGGAVDDCGARALSFLSCSSFRAGHHRPHLSTPSLSFPFAPVARKKKGIRK